MDFYFGFDFIPQYIVKLTRKSKPKEKGSKSKKTSFNDTLYKWVEIFIMDFKELFDEIPQRTAKTMCEHMSEKANVKDREKNLKIIINI